MPVPLEVGVADTLGLRDELEVMEGEAPLEREEVGERLTVDDAEVVEEGVLAGELVALAVGVGVVVVVMDPEPDTLGLGVMVGVPLDDAP